MKRSSGFPTLERPTYSWLCEKTESDRFSSTTFTNCPSTLLTIMVKLSLTRIWSLLNSNGKSVYFRVIPEIKQFPPDKFSFMIVSSMKQGIIPLIVNLVPLKSFGRSRLTIMAKLSLTRIWSLLDSNGKSVYFRVIPEIKQFPPDKFSCMIVSSMKQGIIPLIVNLVPLKSFGRSRLHSSMIDSPSFGSRLYKASRCSRNLSQ